MVRQLRSPNNFKTLSELEEQKFKPEKDPVIRILNGNLAVTRFSRRCGLSLWQADRLARQNKHLASCLINREDIDEIDQDIGDPARLLSIDESRYSAADLADIDAFREAVFTMAVEAIVETYGPSPDPIVGKDCISMGVIGLPSLWLPKESVEDILASFALKHKAKRMNFLMMLFSTVPKERRVIKTPRNEIHPHLPSFRRKW